VPTAFAQRFISTNACGKLLFYEKSVLSFITLDCVMQGPGGPTEDTSGNITLAGWTVPYFDQSLGTIMTEQMSAPFDLLLGRKTFEIFSSFWPSHRQEGAGINNATKYVALTTLTDHGWPKAIKRIINARQKKGEVSTSKSG
jgi:dihydrofolate reductase